VLGEIDARIAVHRVAVERGCSDNCGHPLDEESAAAWREYHEVSLRHEAQLADQTRIELWALLSDEAGRLDVPMADAENILRLPAEQEENDHWLARHEAAHVIVGLALGRTLRYVTIEPDVEHHPDNRGSTIWLDDGPPPRNVDAVTTWAGVIAGPDQAVAQGDLDRLDEIGGLTDDYRWGALRLYRRFEALILEFAAELLHRRTMTGVDAAEWLRERTQPADTQKA
jgi:hypothetical protein